MAADPRTPSQRPTEQSGDVPPFDWTAAETALGAAGHPLHTVREVYWEGTTRDGDLYRLAVHDVADHSAVVFEVLVWLYGPEDRRYRAVALPYLRPGPLPPRFPERYHARFPDGGGEVFVAVSVPLPCEPPALVAALDELQGAAHAARSRFTRLR